MHHGIRVMTGKSSFDLLAIGKFTFDKMRSRINGPAMAFTKVVENSNFMPLIQQELGADAPDVARAANDKDFHWRGKCSVISGKSKATRQVSAAYRAGLLVACC
jgi:hypothetical protein